MTTLISKIIALVNILFLLSGCAMTCGNTSIETKMAPNGEYIATSYIRDCGATTDFSTQVKITHEGNEEIVFVMNGRDVDINLEWDKNNQLSIYYHGEPEEIFKLEKQWKSININFHRIQPIFQNSS
jgi:hypothetical protein